MACKVLLLSKMSIFIQNIKVYCVNSNFLSKSSIYKLQVDETMMIVTKKLNKHICQGFTVPLLLLIYPMSLSAEFLFQIITKEVH